MDSERISVIVPVYNVEPWLRESLESIRTQTYANLEILLVDDGSTDRSGAICDEYAARDARFVVIHQENAGVAAARNTGLEHAHGAWIGFVDPDDIAEPRLFELLYVEAVSSNADIVVCGDCCFGEDDRVNTYPTGEMDPKAAIYHIINNDGMNPQLWNKLYRRCVFDGVRFPPGAILEDLRVMPLLFGAARKVVVIGDVLYMRRKRRDSLSGFNRGRYAHERLLGRERWAEDLRGTEFYLPARMYLLRGIRLDLIYMFAHDDIDLQYYRELTVRGRRMLREVASLMAPGKWVRYCLFFLSPRFYLNLKSILRRNVGGGRYS